MNVARAFYNFLRMLGREHRRRLVETALTHIEASEDASAQRTIAAVREDSACPPSS